MLPDRAVTVRAALAVLAISAVSLLFIASYAGALHEPRAHEIPVAVAGPDSLARQLASSSAIRIKRAADRAAALRRIDRREAYGAVVASGRGLELVTAPAAGPAVASALSEELAPQLRPVAQRVVHRLSEADSRGLVGFYTAVGWVVAGYLGATFLGIVFGAQPGRLHTVWRLAALAALAVVVGFLGAWMAAAIGDFGGSVALLGLVGALTVACVGAVTAGLQSALGIPGTGIAILIFVVLGNPSSGGPFAVELLPGLWRTIGPAIPTGAATTAIRDVAYFPDAPLGGPILILLAWLVAGAAVALALGHRRGPLTDQEAAAALAGAAAP